MNASRNITVSSRSLLEKVGTLALFVALFTFASITPSHADTLGDIFCRVGLNLYYFTWVFQYVADGVAVFCVAFGIYELGKHTENPREHPLKNGVIYLIVSMMLFSLPSVLEIIIYSIYGEDSGGAGLMCDASGSGAGGGSPGLDTIMANLVDNIKAPMESLIAVIGAAMGIYMTVLGLVKASKYGVDPRSNNITSILSNIIIGAILFSLATNIDYVMATVFGDPEVMPSEALSWSSGTGVSAQFQRAIDAALTFVKIIGLIAFIRGWKIMKDAVEGNGQASAAQALTHIIGGVLAINIPRFLEVMDNTLGTGLLT